MTSGMTPKMREALRLLREHGDPVIGHGGGVVTSSATHLSSGQPWIHFHTALALERAGYADVTYDFDCAEITLRFGENGDAA